MAAALLASCQQPVTGVQARPGEESLPPLLERLRQAYPELRGSTFLALACFESPEEVNLFRVVDAGGSPGRQQPRLDLLRSRNETGAAGMTARLGEGETLRLDGARSNELALPRDWRSYALLMMSAYGPEGGATVELAVESGAAERWQRRVALQPGWNTLRIDLDEMAGAVDLANVRSVSWRGAAGAVDLTLDDVLLADNTRYLLGTDAKLPEPYVLAQGRRLHVGYGGRFDLAFRDGVIVGWRSTPGARNAAGQGGIGPWPMPVAADWLSRSPLPQHDGMAEWAAGAAPISARQRLVERSAVRTVIEGAWELGADGPGRESGAASSAWRYVIYPDGRLYVTVNADPGARGWPAPRLAHAFALDARLGFELHAAGAGRWPLVLLARSGPQADLLCVPSDPQDAAVVARGDEDGGRLVALAGDREASGRHASAWMLRVWPGDIDGPVEAATFAADYQSPARLAVRLGAVVRDAPGDADGDGFNEAEGCYELALHEGALRLRLESLGLLRHQPLLRLHGVEGRCWAYVDGRPVEPIGRDGDGRWLLLLPGASERDRDVEVFTRPAAE